MITREEVYDKCTEKIANAASPKHSHLDVCGFVKVKEDEIVWTIKQLLPREAIDAIIDCAVEEAQKKIKEK